MTYASLVDELGKDGVTEGHRAIVSRISRGTLKFSLFLHILSIANGRPPARWTQALSLPGLWEARASAVTRVELIRQPTESSRDIVARLEKLGTSISHKTFHTHVHEGTLTLAVFLQLLYVLNSDSAERYIDFEDLASAAKASYVQNN
jgi:hypothetical protein